MSVFCESTQKRKNKENIFKKQSYKNMHKETTFFEKNISKIKKCQENREDTFQFF